MRFNSMLATILAGLLFAQVAVADWAENLTTLPPAGTEVPDLITMRNGGEYYYFIPATDTTDSSWLQLPNGTVVDIYYDSDTTSTTPGAGTGEIQIYYIPGETTSCPTTNADSNAQLWMLGATLDGAGAASGTPNDSIRNITGPMCLKVNVSAATAAGDTSLVSLIVKTE
jgi:hypothetical protein